MARFLYAFTLRCRMTKGIDVQAAVYNFMLTAFGGEQYAGIPYADRMEDALTLMTAHQTLRADTLAAWPRETRAAAFRWLSQLVIFVSLFEDLPFPQGFLAGTTPHRLGEPVISYIQHYRVELAGLGSRNPANG
jgi:hypothetical protein